MNEWLWRYEGYDADTEGQRETLCTLGNGYVATRGALAETRADGVHYPGTYLAGVFNRLTTEVERRRVENESLVNAPNWLPLRCRAVGGEWFEPDGCDVLDHAVELDLRRGLLTRRSVLRDSAGQRLICTQRRLVSMRNPHLMMLETTLSAEGWSGAIDVESSLDGTVRNAGVPRYAAFDDDHLMHRGSGRRDDGTTWLAVETSDSHVRIAESARLRVLVNGAPAEVERRVEAGERRVDERIRLELVPHQELVLEKTVTIATSRDPGIYEPVKSTGEMAVAAGSFDVEMERHLTSWGHIWNRSRIGIEGDVGSTPRLLNLHIFHLLQTVSKATTDLDVGVPARGLHGEGYRGHIFWDELFIFPFLSLRVPELTRGLLRYRTRRLEAARQAAQAQGFGGAMYPWQSGSDGREETQTIHLNPRSGRWLPDASHLQRHIAATVSYNVWHYWQVTGDEEFMRFWGAETMLEIARFWSSIAVYDHSLDRYEIKGVIGPDEYHDAYPWSDEPGLDNNAYTNVMAVWCLMRAFDALESVPSPRATELREKLALTAEEMDRWGDVSRKMRLCFHGDRILSQFEGYDRLDEFDFERYRATNGNIQRLDRILEAEHDTPNRYRVSKQADTLMLFYVFSTEELAGIFDRLGYEFDDDFAARNIRYYDSRTVDGSTLSSMVRAWIMSRLDRTRSWELFRTALLADINDVQGGTTREGIHLGAMAGTVDLIQRCYGGIETRDGVLFLNPVLPDQLHEVRFTIRYRGHQVALRISPSEVHARVGDDREGDARSIVIDVRGQRYELAPGGSLTVRAGDAGAEVR
jgi:trehalose/maltose hydrolase-like predicted phosphorylase